jgi:hypothetical protein
MKILKSSYFVRIKPQLMGINSVHKEGCPFMPDIEDRIYLGEYSSGLEALREAKLYFSEVSCCCFCVRESLRTKKKITHGSLSRYCEFGFLNISDYN